VYPHGSRKAACCWCFEKIANFFLNFLASIGINIVVRKKWDMGGGDLEVVVTEEMVVVAKGKLLKSRLPRRSEKRKALDVKSAGTQHRHPRGRSPPHLVTPEAS
jgi:hypothetical protein